MTTALPVSATIAASNSKRIKLTSGSIHVIASPRRCQWDTEHRPVRLTEAILTSSCTPLMDFLSLPLLLQYSAVTNRVTGRDPGVLLACGRRRSTRSQAI